MPYEALIMHFTIDIHRMEGTVPTWPVVSIQRVSNRRGNRGVFSPILTLFYHLFLVSPFRHSHHGRRLDVSTDCERGEEHRVPQTGAPHFTPRPAPGAPLPAEAMLRWGSHCCSCTFLPHPHDTSGHKVSLKWGLGDKTCLRINSHMMMFYF